ncbi:MAG: ABC transporter permease [Thermoguttaceae bacterium]
MYTFLLSWRYLLTRYIALVSVVSVMLGVATLIVVNAVMLGFTTKMQDRIHGILSDVVFKSRSLGGFPDADRHMAEMMRVAGDKIEALTPTVVVPAMMSFRSGVDGSYYHQPVELIGIDEVTQGKVSQMAEFLQHPENRREISFNLHDSGYATHAADAGPKEAIRERMADAGWLYRRNSVAERELMFRRQDAAAEAARRARLAADGQLVTGDEAPANPFAVTSENDDPSTFNPAREQHTGIIIGIGLSRYDRYEGEDKKTGKKQVYDELAIIPGDDVMLTYPTASSPPKGGSDSFTVVDLYESKMMEYDTRMVFVPLKKLQELRGMVNPETGQRMVTQILIKAKPGANIAELRDKLKATFSPYQYSIETWQDVQETLLAAVFTEVAVLNVLLFMIIAVAGFGILAIFFMIVVEKTKDIGILKSLGASSVGVMRIFLIYSLALGIVGSGGGMILGLTFVAYIQQIADTLSRVTGHNVFDPSIYSFYEIPTIVQPWTVFWIVTGAIGIAVAAGVLPALRAARMHPVDSLRS